jgi:hypothetical protein
MMKWNLDIQRELTPGLLASVGYVGSRGVHQWMDSQFQTCLPEFAPSVEGQPFFRQGCNTQRNSNFSGINLIRAIGGSQYHALMAKVNRRFANGVSFQASYTWSKSTDDDNGYRTPGARSNTALIWKGTEDDPKLWKGLSTHDVRANFTFNGSWALPGPQGGWAGAIAGGWQVNGILRVASGSPFTPVSTRNPTGGASGRQPGNLVGTDKNPIDPGNSLKYYDTSAFVNPTRITDPAVIPGCTAAARCDFLGNGGRNTVISSGYNTFDFSLFKQWSVPQMGEQGAIEFRSEFFNIFNRANFATPGITIGAGSAGRIDFLTSTARQIQFGLKVIF